MDIMGQLPIPRKRIYAGAGRSITAENEFNGSSLRSKSFRSGVFCEKGEFSVSWLHEGSLTLRFGQKR